ncbi:MAG: EAL domain-containing protein [Pseudolabrys sp.]
MNSAQFKLALQLDRIVAGYLKHCHVRPEQLELELTESVMIETAQRHSEAFRRLQRLGGRLAIDDFGTGYSSLDYLRSFHVSRLKIDRSFIDGVTDNPDDAAIVRATIGLTHVLGIEVLAEGVETDEQRKFLLVAGCKLAQGFYYSRPVPADVAAELLGERRQLAAGRPHPNPRPSEPAKISLRTRENGARKGFAACRSGLQNRGETAVFLGPGAPPKMVLNQQINCR